MAVYGPIMLICQVKSTVQNYTGRANFDYNRAVSLFMVNPAHAAAGRASAGVWLPSLLSQRYQESVLMSRRISGLLITCWLLLLFSCSSSRATESRTTHLQPTATPIPTVTATTAAETSNSASGVSIPIPEALRVNDNCIICHQVHPPEVVDMEHEPHPSCNACHNGSPVRITCPSCHSMHRVDIEVPNHPNEPNITCERCHADVVPPTPAP